MVERSSSCATEKFAEARIIVWDDIARETKSVEHWNSQEVRKYHQEHQLHLSLDRNFIRKRHDYTARALSSATYNMQNTLVKEGLFLPIYALFGE